MDITVVVGSDTVDDSNDDHQVIVRAVPLSVTAIHRVSQSFGVHERFVVKEVMFTARAVIE